MFRLLAGLKSSKLPTSETTTLWKPEILQMLLLYFSAMGRQRRVCSYIRIMIQYFYIRLANGFIYIVTHLKQL